MSSVGLRGRGWRWRITMDGELMESGVWSMEGEGKRCI
jgi:hypothetical protein